MTRRAYGTRRAAGRIGSTPRGQGYSGREHPRRSRACCNVQPGRRTRGHGIAGRNRPGLGRRRWSPDCLARGTRKWHNSGRVQSRRQAHRHGSSDATARIWDATSGNELARMRGHGHTVISAAFSPDGARVVTASYDKTARLWDARSGEQVAILDGHTNCLESADFSPDGTLIVTASSDGTARLWDAHRRRRAVALLGGHGRGDQFGYLQQRWDARGNGVAGWVGARLGDAEKPASGIVATSIGQDLRRRIQPGWDSHCHGIAGRQGGRVGDDERAGTGRAGRPQGSPRLSHSVRTGRVS